MKYPNILTASKAPEITALIDGMSVIGNGFFFTEEMLNNVEAWLAANTQAAERISQLESQLAEANTARQAAETSLETANATIVTRDAEIERLNNELATAAANFQNTSREQDVQGRQNENWALSDKNPINQLADSVIPKKAK